MRRRTVGRQTYDLSGASSAVRAAIRALQETISVLQGLFWYQEGIMLT